MCWNYQVSLAFSLLFLVTNSYYLVARPRYWKEYLLFGMFYFVMEVFQTIQWLYGNVYGQNDHRQPAIVDQLNLYFNFTKQSQIQIQLQTVSIYDNWQDTLQWFLGYFKNNFRTGVSNCDITNTNFTVVAHILIWLQPILFSYIGFRTSRHNKYFFKVLLWVTGVVLFYSIFSLYQGHYYQDYYQIENSIYGSSTCTNRGPTGHLVWRFKPRSVDYFPNYLLYLIMCALSFFFYDDIRTQIIGIGWLASLVFTKFILTPTLIEMASSWCLLSIGANFFIIGFLKLYF